MVAAVTNLPRMGRLRRFAVDRRARTTAAAPSETWDALPSLREEGRVNKKIVEGELGTYLRE